MPAGSSTNGRRGTTRSGPTEGCAARPQPDIGLEPQRTRAEAKLESRRVSETETRRGAPAENLGARQYLVSKLHCEYSHSTYEAPRLARRMNDQVRDPRLLTGRSKLPPISYCVFDLEATLFWSERFKAATHEEAVKCVADLLGLSPVAAKSQIAEKRRAMSVELGFDPALSTTLVSLGVPLHEWATYQSRVSELATISPLPEIAHGLRNLSEFVSVLVYTNMCLALAERVLTHLRLRSAVRHLLTPQQLGATKPSAEAVSRIVTDRLIVPSRTLSVGDRYFLDIQPVTAVGGYGFLVKSPADLSQLLSGLIAQGAL